MQIIGQIIIPNVYSLYPDTMQIYYKQSNVSVVLESQMWRSSQHQAHHSRWVICLSMFASRSYLCYSFLLKLCVYAIFGAFSNYANINLIIQGELTAFQCLLLFITLDETGNWRGCIAWVRISSSSSAAAYICMISLFSVYFPSYIQIYVFSLLYLNFPVHFLCI